MKFLHLTEITVEVSVLILLISMVRSLFRKKLNPNIRYFLWLFVAVRILIPFKPDVSLELPENWNYVPLRTLAEQTAYGEKEETGNPGQNFQQENSAVASMLPAVFSEEVPAMESSEKNLQEDESQEKGMTVSGQQTFFLFWLCGVILMTRYVLLENVRLFRTLKAGRREIRRLSNKIPLYAMPDYNCLTGVLFPAIYVDIDGLKDSAVVQDVIRHEWQHYRVRDNYWQFFRVLCLIIQWYNPLMWWAYFASKKDSELACDARVVKNMSKEERYGYGNSLLTVLECAVKKKQNIGFHISMEANKKFISERINVIIKYKPEKNVALPMVIIAVIGCVCFISLHVSEKEGKTESVRISTAGSILADKGTEQKEVQSAETEDGSQTAGQMMEESDIPTKEEVLAARELVLEGMSEEEIERLKENIKVANMAMESAYMNDNIFKKLEDEENLYWNYFDEKGEIQVGWVYDGDYQEMRAVMKEENLTLDEFYSRYGTPVTVYNRFDAGNFMELMAEMKGTVKNEKLRNDLQKIIDETGLAAETHEMEHANNIYKLLHDMDYYLLRYGLEDVGKYVWDVSTIAKYYGVLSVYD